MLLVIIFYEYLRIKEITLILFSDKNVIHNCMYIFLRLLITIKVFRGNTAFNMIDF